MPNRIIELHDSRIGAICKVGRQVIVFFSHAYLHVSDGRAGWDKGRGFSQAAALIFDEASVESDAFEWAGDIWEGDLYADDHIFENTIPIPFDYAGEVTLKLHIDTPAQVVVKGKKAVLTLIGEAVYVEEFSGADIEPTTG